MPDIVRVVEELVQKGSAYEVDGDVYFEVRKFPGYGKLSGRSLEDMQAGARVEVDTRKRDPMDFAVWKAAKPGEPSWDRPWGPGRPGWHIECSVMSLKYLGPGFDIHGGGYDLIFPHHENEIAQSEAATGKTFVRYWMHNGFITVKEEKMSKSLGNFFLVRDILAKFSPEVVRFFLLSTHYRSPLDFDDEKLAAAGRGLERIKTSIRLLTEALAREEEMRGEGDGEAGPGPAEVPGKGKEAADSLKAALDEMKASLSPPWTMISTRPWPSALFLTWPGRSTVLSSSWAQRFPCPKRKPCKKPWLYSTPLTRSPVYLKLTPPAGFFWKIPQRKNQA